MFRGVLVIIGCNLVIGIVTFRFWLINNFGYLAQQNSPLKILGYAFTYIGWFQFLYITPLVFFLIWRQRGEFMKGVIIGAAITVFLNSGCNLLFSIPLLPN
jgi:signal transduction histidine kinase